VGNYKVALAATDVVAIMVDDGDRECHVDLHPLLQVASCSDGRQVRFSNSPVCVRVGANVWLQQVSASSVHEVPGFVSDVLSRVSIKSFVVLGESEIAFLIDPLSIHAVTTKGSERS